MGNVVTKRLAGWLATLLLFSDVSLPQKNSGLIIGGDPVQEYRSKFKSYITGIVRQSIDSVNYANNAIREHHGLLKIENRYKLACEDEVWGKGKLVQQKVKLVHKIRKLNNEQDRWIRKAETLNEDSKQYSKLLNRIENRSNELRELDIQYKFRELIYAHKGIDMDIPCLGMPEVEKIPDVEVEIFYEDVIPDGVVETTIEYLGIEDVQSFVKYLEQ